MKIQKKVLKESGYIHFKFRKEAVKKAISLTLAEVEKIIGEEETKLKELYNAGKIFDDVYFFVTSQLEQLKKNIKGEGK